MVAFKSKPPRYKCPGCKQWMKTDYIGEHVKTKGSLWWKEIISRRFIVRLICPWFCESAAYFEWQDAERTWTFNELRMEGIYDCSILRVAPA